MCDLCSTFFIIQTFRSSLLYLEDPNFENIRIFPSQEFAKNKNWDQKRGVEKMFQQYKWLVPQNEAAGSNAKKKRLHHGSAIHILSCPGQFKRGNVSYLILSPFMCKIHVPAIPMACPCHIWASWYISSLSTPCLVMSPLFLSLVKICLTPPSITGSLL